MISVNLTRMVCILASLAVVPVFGQTIAVDDSDGAPTYTTTGTWSTTSNAGAGFDGGLYQFSQQSGPLSTATWTPDFPGDGAYEVFAVFRRSGDRTNLAPYSITHRDGTAQRTLDQTGVFSGDLGVESLGAYRFLAGTGGAVTLSNEGGSGVYIADAILFVPDSPPEIQSVAYSPLYPSANEDLTVTAQVTDSAGLDSVMIDWQKDGGAVASINASNVGDVYTATIPGQEDGAVISFTIKATDQLGSTTLDGPYSVTIGESGTWQLVINEVMASNSATASDPDFDASSDWIELYNVGPDTADLTGLALSDDPANPGKWLVPNGVALAPDSYLLIWCDNENTQGVGLHSSFALSANGESAILYDTVSETVLDQVDWAAMVTDESLARIPNATGEFAMTIDPSPRASNLLGLRGDAPTFSVPSGVYTDSFQVVISAPDEADVRYTLDGSAPTLSSAVYTDTLTISETTGLRARAFYEDVEPSNITTASYFYHTDSDRTIPVINLVVDPDDLFDPTTGIYPNFEERGSDWERLAHVSIFSPDGTVNESMDAGLRIHGGFSRSAAKRSFRLYFRNQYGTPTVNLPFLEKSPVSEINQLVLRAGGNDGFLVTSTSQLQEVTFIRDQIMRDWYRQQGHYAADGFFAALYLNGEYWGLYNATERITDDQMGAAFGGGSDYDIVKGTWNYEQKYFTEATDGDLTAWNEFLSWMESSDIASDQGMTELKERIDYRNFLDFFALNIFCQNEDWPHNNWIASRHQTNDDRWIFHEWDTEWGMGLRPQGWQSDSMQWAMGQNFHLSASHNGKIAPLSMLFNGNNLDSNRPFDVNGILDHPNGLKDFLVSMEDFINFQMPSEKTISEFDVYVDQIRSEVPREAARWSSATGTNASTLATYWDGAVVNLRNFLSNRTSYIHNLLDSKFAIGGTRTITFQSAGPGSGKLLIRGQVVELPWTGTFFNGSDVDLIALADGNSSFENWSGLFSGSEVERVYTTESGSNATVTMTFGAAAGSVYTANDVIFNEYWVNDNGIVYDSIGTAIDRDWFELLVVRPNVDLRGWRVTNNPALATNDALDSGSILFPDLPVLSSVPAGTIILVVSSINEINDASFPEDDLDLADGRLILYAGNGNLDLTTDPEFGLSNGDEAVVLLAPGISDSFADDIGIDFIAEGTRITPASFFGDDNSPVVFENPFAGIGSDDGAIFLNDPTGGFNNDNGADSDRTDFLPGLGGWIVDPPSEFSGDVVEGGQNFLTPGAPNRGQNLSRLRSSDLWVVQ